MRMLGERAGYQDLLTPYAVRRGHGNALDNMFTVAERKHRMGHSREEIFDSYISSVSVVDSQAIIFGQEPQRRIFDLTRSMTLHKDTSAPMPMSSRLSGQNAITRPKDFVGSKVSEVQKRSLLRSARQQWCDQLQASIFADDPETAPYDSRHISRYLKALMRCDPPRHRIASSIPDAEHPATAPRADFIEMTRHFHHAGQSRSLKLRYPGIAPGVHGCVYCGKAVPSGTGAQSVLTTVWVCAIADLF